MSSPDSPARPLPAVTVLCGFLGAGKTTVLNRLLAQADGERWALVVNDVGAINIDARQIAARAAEIGDKMQPAAQPVVELGNGCVCCSIKDELAEKLTELALTGRAGGPAGDPYLHIVVETTGVAEPRGVANLFLQRNPFGRSLSDFARLSALVTVIDAAHFLRLWRDHVAQPKGGMRALAAAGRKSIFDLMLEQVEVSDLLLVNKSDLVSFEELAQLDHGLEGLNPRAERHAIEQGQIAREIVLDRIRFDPRETLSSARWLQSLNAVAPLAGRPQGGFVQRRPVVETAKNVRANDSNAGRPDFESKYGLRSFVYQARRPFDRGRFEAFIRAGIPGLVRAKGFCWWADQPDEMGFLSVAGDEVRFETLNYWWAALVENGKATLVDRPRMIVALWEEPSGDRRQELVFIGQGLAEDAVRSGLDLCFDVA